MLWSGIEPLTGHARFAEACDAVRAEAETQADALGPTDLVRELSDLGYGPAELDEIRACIEVFSAGNMPYVLMATMARLLLEGQAWTASSDPGGPRVGPAHPKPPLMEAHHADAPTRAVYGDVMATLGLPFVNTDYRALARWPSYFAMAWQDLRGVVHSAPYPDAVASVHQKAVSLVRAIPSPAGLTPDGLINAAQQDAPVEEVLQVVRLFQWLLPGLAVNVACLRAHIG